MKSMLRLPIISDKPGILIRITADEETISEFFVILFRDLGLPPRLQIDLSQDSDHKHTIYAFIKFESQDMLEMVVKDLEKVLKGIPNISWDIVPLKEYGMYYAVEEIPEFSIENLDEPLVMISLSRFARAFEMMYKCMGTGSYVVIYQLGKESGRWIAEKHEKAARILVEQRRIRDLIELLFKALAHLRNVPKSEVVQKGNEIKVTFKKDEYFEAIMHLVTRFAYGVVVGLFESLGYTTVTEVDVEGAGGIKEVNVVIDSEKWRIVISSEQ